MKEEEHECSVEGCKAETYISGVCESCACTGAANSSAQAQPGRLRAQQVPRCHRKGRPRNGALSPNGEQLLPSVWCLACTCLYSHLNRCMAVWVRKNQASCAIIATSTKSQIWRGEKLGWAVAASWFQLRATVDMQLTIRAGKVECMHAGQRAACQPSGGPMHAAQCQDGHGACVQARELLAGGHACSTASQLYGIGVQAKQLRSVPGRCSPTQ